MTKKERNNPEVLIAGTTSASRKKRIAQGSGTSVQEVNNLIKQFSEMKKMMKKVNQAQQLQQKGKKMFRR
jgi:signal recognition particle subunit SRP54